MAYNKTPTSSPLPVVLYPDTSGIAVANNRTKRKAYNIRVSDADEARVNALVGAENQRREVRRMAPLSASAIVLVAFRLGMEQLEDGERIIAGERKG